MSSCCCCPTCWADPSLPKPRFGTQNLAKQKFVIILLAFSLLPLLSIFPRVFMLFLSICNLRYSSFFPLISYFFTPFLFYLVSLFFTHPFPFFPSSVFAIPFACRVVEDFVVKAAFQKYQRRSASKGLRFPSCRRARASQCQGARALRPGGSAASSCATASASVAVAAAAQGLVCCWG